ncbi:MAG: DNA polymerase III subunit delta' [Methylophilaceae bacterium]
MQRKNILPHAILLRGRAGIGKHDFAFELSRTLLCQQTNHDQACGVCANCLWFAEGTHPDFKWIAPESEEEIEDAPKKKASRKSQISVVQIRQLIDYLSLSSHQVGAKRVVLISPAETLNLASSNALLKILEEPPANTLFLLVTSQSQRLLPTIISRCQVVEMILPERAVAIYWLKSQGLEHAESALAYAGGSPLLALQASSETNASLIKQLAQGARIDVFNSAAAFLSLGMERALETLQKWVFDLLCFKLTQQLRYHTQQANALQALSKSVNLGLLIRFQQTLVEAKKTANHPLSNEMQLENMLLQYTQIFLK